MGSLPAAEYSARREIFRATFRTSIGGLAQLAERVLSMHEVLGSIPKFSTPNSQFSLRYSVGGYHGSLSRFQPGFESQYRNSDFVAERSKALC